MNSSPFADVLARTFLGNSVRAWIIAAITATVMFFALLALRALITSRIGKVAERTTNRFDDMAVGPEVLRRATDMGLGTWLSL